MSHNTRILSAVALSVLVGTAASAGATTAATVGAMKPVIGKPVSVPRVPLAGKRFTLSYKVTRSDTGKPLTTGKMICDPSSAGREIAHAESFKAGIAKLTFVIPSSAKLLTVNVTIVSGGQSAKKVSTFKVTGGYIPTLSVADATVAEGNAGTPVLSFPVALSAKSTDTVSVDYATADGTATQPGDYATAIGTLTFKPGETAKTIAVSVVGDTTYEPDETLSVTLSKPVAATIADGSAAGTITNEDTLATPGHYTGRTSQNETLDFDVPASGAKVTGFRLNVNFSCSRCIYVRPGKRACGTGRGTWIVRGSTSQLRFDFGPESFPITQERSFAVNRVFDEVITSSESGEEVPAKLSIAVTGRFSDVEASGTMLVSLTFDTADEEWTCTTYSQTWTAARAG